MTQPLYNKVNIFWWPNWTIKFEMCDV